MDLLCVHLCCKFAVITVNDRRISRCRDRIAERVYHICEILDRKVHDIVGLHVHSDRVFHAVAGNFIHCIRCRCLRLIHRSRLKEYIRRCLYSILRSTFHIFLIVFIHGILSLIAEGAHADIRKWNIIRSNLCPVDISLPLGNADSPKKRSIHVHSIGIHINTVYLLPGSCRITCTGICGCLILILISGSDLIRKRRNTSLCDHQRCEDCCHISKFFLKHSAFAFLFCLCFMSQVYYNFPLFLLRTSYVFVVTVLRLCGKIPASRHKIRESQ